MSRPTLRDRRGFLQVRALGAFGLTLPEYLRRRAIATPTASSAAQEDFAGGWAAQRLLSGGYLR